MKQDANIDAVFVLRVTLLQQLGDTLMHQWSNKQPCKQKQQQTMNLTSVTKFLFLCYVEIT